MASLRLAIKASLAQSQPPALPQQTTRKRGKAASSPPSKKSKATAAGPPSWTRGDVQLRPTRATLRGLNVQRPWAPMLLDGSKVIETRTYDIDKQKCFANEWFWVVETPGKSGSGASGRTSPAVLNFRASRCATRRLHSGARTKISTAFRPGRNTTGTDAAPCTLLASRARLAAAAQSPPEARSSKGVINVAKHTPSRGPCRGAGGSPERRHNVFGRGPERKLQVRRCFFNIMIRTDAAAWGICP